MTIVDEANRVYRVDNFSVPGQARSAFLDKVQKTHEALREVEGFVQDFILEQTAGPSEFNVVTIVVWESAKAVERARDAVAARHREMNFDPREMYAKLEIKANVGTYTKNKR